MPSLALLSSVFHLPMRIALLLLLLAIFTILAARPGHGGSCPFPPQSNPEVHCWASGSSPSLNSAATTDTTLSLSWTLGIEENDLDNCHGNDEFKLVRSFIFTELTWAENPMPPTSHEISGLSPGGVYPIQTKFYQKECQNTRFGGLGYFRTSCPTGQRYHNGGCQNCPANQYRDTNTRPGDTACTGCTGFRNTDGADGRTSVNDCLCDKGYEGPLDGNTPCTPCADAFYKDTIASTSCTSCGNHMTTDGAIADDFSDCLCLPGYFQQSAEVGDPICIECPIGTYKSGPANPTACTSCVEGGTPGTQGSTTLGTNSTDNSYCVCGLGYEGSFPACTACPQGFFSNTTENGGSCFPCPGGTTTPFGVAASSFDQCTDCASGFYGPDCTPCTCTPDQRCLDGKDNNGTCTCNGDQGEETGLLLPSCDVCGHPDFYGPDCNQTVVCDESRGNKEVPGSGTDGTGFCGSCKAGRYDFLANPPCTACTPPNFGPDCTACNPGWGYPSSGGVCFECPAGTTKPGNGPQETCSNCPPGTASTATGLSSPCPPCLRATYQPTEGSTSCIPCGPGMTNGGPGSSQAELCTPCPLGTYKTAEGYDPVTDGGCTVCAGNMTTAFVQATQAEDCACPTGQGLYPGTALGDASVCTTCLPGDVALEFGLECTTCPTGTLYSAPSVPCLPCPFGGRCGGGTSLPVAAPGYHPVPGSGPNDGFYEPCVPPGVCLGNGVCRQGHADGERCSKCISGWIRNPASGFCEKCPSYIIWIFVGLFTLGGIMLIFLIRFARKNSSMLTTTAVGFNYIQIIGILSSYQLEWPTWVQSVFDALSSVNLDLQIFKPECLASDSARAYETIWAVKLASPWVLWVMLFFMYLFMVQYSKLVCASTWFRRSKTAGQWKTKLLPDLPPSNLGVMRSACINAGIMVAIVLYLMVSNSAMEIFPCTRSEDGTLTMNREPSIVCGSKEWKNLLIGSLLTLFFFSLAFPSIIALILFRKREGLWKRKAQARYGLLILRYKPRFFLFELAVLARKFLIVFAKTIFRTNLSGQVGFAFSVVLCATGVQLWLHPFAALRINRLETVMLGFATIVLLLALLFAAAGGDMSNGVSTTIGVILVSVVILSLIVLLVVIALEMWKIRKLRNSGVVGRYSLDSIDVWDSFFELGMHLTLHHQRQQVELDAAGDQGGAPVFFTQVDLGFLTDVPVELHAQVVLEQEFDNSTGGAPGVPLPGVEELVTPEAKRQARTPVYFRGRADGGGVDHALVLILPRYGNYSVTLVAVDVASAPDFRPSPPPTGLAAFGAWVKRVVDGDHRSSVYAPEIVRAMMVSGGRLAFKCRLASSPEWSVLDSMARNVEDGDMAGGAMENKLLAGSEPDRFSAYAGTEFELEDVYVGDAPARPVRVSTPQPLVPPSPDGAFFPPPPAPRVDPPERPSERPPPRPERPSDVIVEL